MNRSRPSQGLNGWKLSTNLFGLWSMFVGMLLARSSLEHRRSRGREGWCGRIVGPVSSGGDAPLRDVEVVEGW